MDYQKFKIKKNNNEFNKKTILNETLNHPYTESSEKTAPTNASEAIKTRSARFFNTNYQNYLENKFENKNNLVYSKKSNENFYKKNKTDINDFEKCLNENKKNQHNKSNKNYYLNKARETIDNYIEENRNIKNICIRRK